MTFWALLKQMYLENGKASISPIEIKIILMIKILPKHWLIRYIETDIKIEPQKNDFCFWTFFFQNS
jgi:hypothetical protein